MAETVTTLERAIEVINKYHGEQYGVRYVIRNILGVTGVGTDDRPEKLTYTVFVAISVANQLLRDAEAKAEQDMQAAVAAILGSTRRPMPAGFGSIGLEARSDDAEPKAAEIASPVSSCPATPTPDELGRIAYEVMQAAIKPHLASHRYTPAWDRLDEMLQAGWIAAAEAVAEKVKQGAEKPAVGPAPTWGDSLPEYRGRDRRYYFREYTDVSGSRTVSVHPQFPRECQIGPHPRNRYCLIPLPVETGGKAKP